MDSDVHKHIDGIHRHTPSIYCHFLIQPSLFQDMLPSYESRISPADFDKSDFHTGLTIMKSSLRRGGAAAIELAISLPVLATLTFAGINVAAAINLKHHAKLISFNGATLAMDTSNDFDSIVTKSEAIATTVGLVGVEITVNRQDGEYVLVTSRIPVAPNNPLHKAFPLSGEVVASSIAFRPHELRSRTISFTGLIFAIP